MPGKGWFSAINGMNHGFANNEWGMEQDDTRIGQPSWVKAWVELRTLGWGRNHGFVKTIDGVEDLSEVTGGHACDMRVTCV